MGSGVAYPFLAQYLAKGRRGDLYAHLALSLTGKSHAAKQVRLLVVAVFMRLAWASALVLLSASCLQGTVVFAQANKAAESNRYSTQKKEMDDYTYVLYRLLERIVQSNNIDQPISIASRALGDCAGKGLLCDLAASMPSIDKQDNVLIWAVQVINSTQGAINADADSSNNLIRIGKSLQNALTSKPHALACVVAHEAAHITQNHSKKQEQYRFDLDKTAASKIESAAKNAHAAKKSNEFWTAVAVGLNAFNSGMYSGAGNYAAASRANFSNQLIMAQYAADINAGGAMAGQYKEIIQKSMPILAPRTMSSLNGLNGLSASLVKRTMKDVDQYLRDFRVKYMELSREHELEADGIALQYVANAGLDPRGCLEVVELLHRQSGDTSTNPLATHPGERERLNAMNSNYEKLPYRLKNKYKYDQPKRPLLPYFFDKDSQIVRIVPDGGGVAKSGRNSRTDAVETVLGD